MKKIDKIRLAFCNYVRTEGCSCCEHDSHQKEDKEIICRLLKIPRYKDNSGWDIYSIIKQLNPAQTKDER